MAVQQQLVRKWKTVESRANVPREEDLPTHVIVVPAMVSGLNGPVYAMLESSHKLPGKTILGKRSRNAKVWRARRITGNDLEEETFCVPHSLVTLATGKAFATGADEYLYKFGRIARNNILYCVQVTGYSFDAEERLFLTVHCRNGDPQQEFMSVAVDEFMEISYHQFVCAIGHGVPKSKSNILRHWGECFDVRLSTAACIFELVGERSQLAPMFVPGCSLTILGDAGETTEILITKDVEMQDTTTSTVNGALVKQENTSTESITTIVPSTESMKHPQRPFENIQEIPKEDISYEEVSKILREFHHSMNWRKINEWTEQFANSLLLKGKVQEKIIDFAYMDSTLGLMAVARKLRSSSDNRSITKVLDCIQVVISTYIGGYPSIQNWMACKYAEWYWMLSWVEKKAATGASYSPHHRPEKLYQLVKNLEKLNRWIKINRE